MEQRRFPPPWNVVELGESFAIEDASGRRLAFVHFEPDPNNDTRRQVMDRLTRDEARRIAVNIAKLPTLIEAEAKSKVAN